MSANGQAPKKRKWVPYYEKLPADDMRAVNAKEFAAKFAGRIEYPDRYAGAIANRTQRGNMRRYRIPFAELHNQALLFLWEANAMLDANGPDMLRHRVWQKAENPEEKGQWIEVVWKPSTFLWKRAASYLNGYVQSLYRRFGFEVPVSMIPKRDGEDESYEEHFITTLLEEPERVGDDEECRSFINYVVRLIRDNGVQGETARTLKQKPELLLKYRRMLEMLAAGFSVTEVAADLGFESVNSVEHVLNMLRKELPNQEDFARAYGPLIKHCNGKRRAESKGPASSYPKTRARKRERVEGDFSNADAAELMEKYGVSRCSAFRAKKQGFLHANVMQSPQFFHHCTGIVLNVEDGNQITIQLENEAKSVVKTHWTPTEQRLAAGQAVEVCWVDTGESGTQDSFYISHEAVEPSGKWQRKSAYKRIHEDTKTFGHQAEGIVFEALKMHGMRVEQATDFEDEKLGVDIWVLFPLTRKEWKWLPLDVSVQISSSLEEAGKAKETLNREVVSARVFPRQITEKNHVEIFRRIMAEITSQLKLAAYHQRSFLPRNVARIRELFWNKKQVALEKAANVAKPKTSANAGSEADEWIII